MLLSVLYDTGARVQELTEIRIKDIPLSDPSVITLHGKGNKIRQVPLMSGTSELLEKYIEIKKYHFGLAKADNYLSTNQKIQQLSRWRVSYILNKYVEMAREKSLFKVSFPITPQILRHAKAMHLLQSGVNLIYIYVIFLGMQIALQQRYTRERTVKLKEKLLKMHMLI